jgi:uncharacterized protein YndB with AHSA1/START domain
MRRPLLIVLAGLLGVGLASGARAEVAAASASGFIIRHELGIAATPAQVHARFFELARWWNGAHTYSGSAANLSLRQEPGACWCERLKDGGFVRHMSLEYSAPGSLIRLSGGLGPLQSLGANGVLTLQLAAEAGGTRARLSYVVSGFQPGEGLLPLAAPVDGVLKEQFERLKRYVETGAPLP